MMTLPHCRFEEEEEEEEIFVLSSLSLSYLAQ